MRNIVPGADEPMTSASTPDTRIGECDIARTSIHAGQAPWVVVVGGDIWDWWERTTHERNLFLDGLPSTLTRQERDFVLERLEIDRPFGAMPREQVIARRGYDEVFGVRYSEHLHRMCITWDELYAAPPDIAAGESDNGPVTR
jgi:hypothetical protein